MGDCSSNNCNPCGPDYNAINQLATKTAAYARQANTYSVDAANSAQNAQNSFLEFNALYLGAFASAPTVDNEGNPLQEGALYFNSVSNEMFVWQGASWIDFDFDEFTPFTATGTTTARNLVTRTSDIYNVKDFGAVGNGIADDSVAFQAAYNSAPDLSTIIVPTGSYKILTNVVPAAGKDVLWEVYGQNAFGMGGTNYFNSGELPGWISQAHNTYGLNDGSCAKKLYKSGSLFLSDVPGASWPTQLSNFMVAGDTGRMAITGFAKNNKGDGIAIGVSGFVINSQPNQVVWGLYSDLQLEASATNGWAHGLEVAAKNKGANANSTPYQKSGGVLGIWLAGGGDPVYGGAPANPSNTGISFIKNGHTWNKGIVFHDTSLTGCDGITGFGSAISMAKGHQIEWWATGTTSPTAYIRCDMTAGAGTQRIYINNGGFEFGTETFAYVDIPRINNAVNGFLFRPEIAGQSPGIFTYGSDANIDLKLQPQGTGRVKFGTHIATADTPITGYIEVRDNATGTIRKLAVIA